MNVSHISQRTKQRYRKRNLPIARVEINGNQSPDNLFFRFRNPMAIPSQTFLISVCILTALLHQSCAHTNFIVNGDFENPRIDNWGKNYQIFDGIPGWSGLLQLGSAKAYNHNWGQGQALDLDADYNSEVTQTISLTERGLYQLEFQCAAKDYVKDLTSAQVAVYWNGVQIFYLLPKDWKVSKIVLLVDARVGKNQLKFIGLGASDYHGMAIDTIKLFKAFQEEDEEQRPIYINGGTVYDIKNLQTDNGELFKERPIKINVKDATVTDYYYEDSRRYEDPEEELYLLRKLFSRAQGFEYDPSLDSRQHLSEENQRLSNHIERTPSNKLQNQLMRSLRAPEIPSPN